MKKLPEAIGILTRNGMCVYYFHVGIVYIESTDRDAIIAEYDQRVQS